MAIKIDKFLISILKIDIIWYNHDWQKKRGEFHEYNCFYIYGSSELGESELLEWAEKIVLKY